MSNEHQYRAPKNAGGIDLNWLVTGAAGFVGTNLSSALIESGDSVILIDDLSRVGVTENAELLARKYRQRVLALDVSNAQELEKVLINTKEIDVIVHLAGQVSFMKSLMNPLRDFEINALGTLNMLEFVRKYSPGTTVIGVSSNKIYGSLDYIQTVETDTRYVAPNFPRGFNESLKLDFQGPYGCSKGTADQYLIDYNRMFGLRTISLRQSSIYGPYQRPSDDQGWVAYFLEKIKSGSPIQLNGRGMQVRDILHVRDWVDLVQLISKMNSSQFGRAFNVGGGQNNAISILELIKYVSDQLGVNPAITFGDVRPSDQKIFVSDNTSIEKATGWEVKIDKIRGINESLANLNGFSNLR
jgi:CDP-paratose 2-epimerase